jgi:hypothetical protein
MRVPQWTDDVSGNAGIRLSTSEGAMTTNRTDEAASVVRAPSPHPSRVLARIQADQPRFHSEADQDSDRGDDGLKDWGANEWMLHSLYDLGQGAKQTLETGCGRSTVLLASMAERHYCIAPREQEFERVSSYCSALGIDVDRITFLGGKSEFVLPNLQIDGMLDLVLIDGAHAFPFPTIDWFYASRNLRVGGYLIVDDVWLPAVADLIRFLDSEPSWRRVRRSLESAAYQKIAEVDDFNDWIPQRYGRTRIWLWQTGVRAVRSIPRPVRHRIRRLLGVK